MLVVVGMLLVLIIAVYGSGGDCGNGSSCVVGSYGGGSGKVFIVCFLL